MSRIEFSSNKERRSGVARLVIVTVALLSACSGGDNSSSDESTAPTVVTSVPSRGGAPGSTDDSTAPVLDAALAAANELLVYPSAIDPVANPGREIPADLATDNSEALEVASAELRDANGVYELVWNLANGVSCVNCAFVEPRVRSIIAAVMEQPFAESVSEVRGADPSRLAAADYAGRGWQAEFVVTSKEVGDQIVAFVTSCGEEECRSGDLRIAEVIWQNKVLESKACGADLATVQASDAYPLAVDQIPADAAADAGIDRVIIASPSYRPVLEANGSSFVVAGWNETGCAS